MGVGVGPARHAAAIENARMAATECGRARVERAEVELYVAELRPRASGSPTVTTGLTLTRPGAGASGEPPLAWAAVSQTPAQPARGPLRVVIAEDEALIRMDLAEMLGRGGLRRRRPGR